MRRRVWWLVAVLVIAGAPIVWYLGSPMFINKTVNEPFPKSTRTSEDTFPMSKGAVVPEGMTHQQVEEIMMKASKENSTATEPMPVGTIPTTVVARGTFIAADSFHHGEGTVAVHHVGQDRVLRLDPFKVTNGPDLHLILTKQSAPKVRADVELGYVEVAKLKGNLGSQNYVLPQGVRLEDYHAVVIYCKMFHVVFSTATLQAPR
ncbi:MAG TPA: DM13 domain-containing protein [bacterium]|nr:DM13 domain-containing protein [bacterium]